MAIPNTFTNGTVANATEVNANFSYVGVVPVGSVISWLKDYTNTPTLDTKFVECNGQTLSDSESVFDGQVIPDLNGDNRFLRGSTTSGSTGGSETHNHQWWESSSGGGTTIDVTSEDSASYNSSGSAIDFYASNDNYTSNYSTLPTYYEVVFVMRIK